MLGLIPRYPFAGQYHDDGDAEDLHAGRVNSFADGSCYVYFCLAYVFVADFVDSGSVFRGFRVDGIGFVLWVYFAADFVFISVFRVYLAADLIIIAGGPAWICSATWGRCPSPALQPGLLSGSHDIGGQNGGTGSTGQRRLRPELSPSSTPQTGYL